MRGRGNPDEKRIRSYMRGPRRGEVVGRVDPGDELENTRDHERLWAALSGARRKAAHALSAAQDITKWGTSHQRIEVQYAGSAAPDISGISYDGFAWVTDPTSFGGGYAEATTDGAFISGLVLLEPKGSVWQFNHRRSEGPDYGKYQVSLTSLVYEDARRWSGDPSGKIDGVDGGGYGSVSGEGDFIDWGAIWDGYTPVGGGDVAADGSLPIIVGGEEGDPLTDVVTGNTDPYLGFQLMDGGPGWYRLKITVTGKHASSSGYRCRLSDILLTRRSDDNAF